MKYKTMLIIFIVSLSFNGCVSRFFSVGEERSYCQEMGCDYRDLGVCANPIEILESKDDLNDIKVRNKERRDANYKWWE